MACETLQQRTTQKGRENSKLQDLYRQEGCGECILNPNKQIQGVTGHNRTKVVGCQSYCFDMCGVAQYAEDTSGWRRQGINPSR